MLAMKTLNEHIKKGEYQKVYLIYGEEEYLKNQYRDRMKAAIIGDDTINYSYFEGDSTKAEDVISMCETMPFFSDRRLVIVSDSSFFKNANDKLADYIKKLPGYIVLIFVEKNVDKRNKVYKAVSSCGYVTEMKYQTPAMLKKWIAGMLSKEHYKVTEAACDLILEKTGANMILKALEAPLFHIAYNAGLEGAVIINKVRESEVGTGFDAYKEEYVNMIDAGILDPAKVTRSALQNATSVASTLLTTESVVANIKEDAPAMPAGGAGMGGMM